MIANQISIFTDPNLRFVLLGTMILGATAAIVGTFSFLRKRALVGDAIAHSILPGICFAFILSASKDPLILISGAMLSGWISIWLIDLIDRKSKLSSDTAIGLILSVFYGFGIMMLTFIQNSGNSSQAGLDKFLFGQAASLTQNDLLVFGSIGIVLILIVIAFFKEFMIISFNPDFAKVIGLPVKFLEFLLASITVLSVAVGIQAVGVVLMAALLITPAAGARFWTDNLVKMILISMLFGGLSGIAGSLISYSAPSMPTGPWVVMCLSIFSVASIWLAPKKGMLYKYKRQKRTEKKILKENILKTFYHAAEAKGNFYEGRSFVELAINRQLKSRVLNKGLFLLVRDNLVRKQDGIWYLTKKGLAEAIRIIRLHRLWEMYLNKRLKLQPDHVHNDAEAIEHIITPEIERLLEKDLGYPEKDPHESIIPNKYIE